MMKLPVLAIAFLLSSNAHAVARNINCRTQLMTPDGPNIKKAISIQITESENGALTARMRHDSESNVWARASVEKSESAIRADVKARAEVSDESMSHAERLVALALTVESEPALAANYTSGIDLKAIRFAKAYDLDRSPGDMATTSVVVAYDENQNYLGTFFSGILIGSCR